MGNSDQLELGRRAHARQAWGEAYSHLTAAGLEAPLELVDLERLAVAAYLTGKEEESAEAWTRAHHESLRVDDKPRAGLFAFWLAFSLLNRGELARGGGWLARAQRLLDEAGRDGPEQGYLLLPNALRQIAEGDAATARATFGQVTQIGERFGDPDLTTMGQLGRGRALILLGEIAEGVALLDEAMVAVTAGEVSPIVVGTVYCAAIEACREIFDLRRAQEWTAALSRWCESQPDLVPYRGECLVYRAEILRLHGSWGDAATEAQRACERLAGRPAAGAAFYQLAELHRLRGDFTKAEDAYRQASQWGRGAQPGLALLRLAQGQVEDAANAIRRATDEAQDRAARSRLLPTHVEVMLAAGDVPAARAAASELSGIAADFDAPLLVALSTGATGAVLLAEGDARAALDALRQALSGWKTLEAPYEAARVRALLGAALQELGDRDSGEMELDAAREALHRLGVGPHLAGVEERFRPGAGPGPRLTGREIEVLRLVAAGKTNRRIAAELFISEKTVARHVSNIFAKLGLSTRAAATAYAYQHHLVQG